MRFIRDGGNGGKGVCIDVCLKGGHGQPIVSRFGLAVRLVSGRTSVRYRFGSPFSLKRLWFVDTVL